MNSTQRAALRDLLLSQPIAALGTLHQGEPFVSMTPVAIRPDGGGFVIHVSRLAGHTQDMLEHPSVSLMVTAPADPDIPPQATPRVSLQGRADPCAPGSPLYADARAAYQARFPEGAQLFEFADFSLFLIEPAQVRYVAGFGQALTISPQVLRGILGQD